MSKTLSLVVITLLLSAVFYNNASAQAPRQFGLILNDTVYDHSPRLATGGKAAVTSPVFSLKNYTPYPANQGTCNSCVCWAASYAALTTSWAFKGNETDKKVITNGAKSPMFTYVQITNSCANGVNIDDALRLLKNQGSCNLTDFNPETYNGENRLVEIEPFKPLAYPYRIKDYATIFPLGADSAAKIDQTKLSIANHLPVITGFAMYPSILKLDKANYLWEPNTTTESRIALHAMCVIGYNDYQKTFEIMNSWGTGWGNEGYFNISYRDYVKLAFYAYQITMDDRPVPDAPIRINGDFELQKFTSWDNQVNAPIFERNH